MTRTITVDRAPGWYGRARALRILVDGTEQARLKVGQSAQLALPDGGGRLTAKMDWGETEPLDASGLRDGAHVVVATRVASPLHWFGLGGLPFRFEVREG